MNRQETIEAVCEIIGVAYNTIGDYSHASDCFCEECQFYRNEGKAIEYVRRAVNRALIADGLTPIRNIDESTGEYIKE